MSKKAAETEDSVLAASRESHIREIMYLGPKKSKRDTVTGNEARVWNGIGDVQRATLMDALKLTKHDMWVDVTGWPEDKRITAVAQKQAELREFARKNAPVPILSAASDAELEEELRRRRQKPTLPKPSKASSSVSSRKTEGQENDDGEARERPDSTEGVAAEILGIVLQMDPGKAELYDQNGDPTLEAVRAALGYDVSALELKAALKSLS